MTEPPAERAFRRWGHSFEEDAEGEAVYRPEDFPFPPARGRRWLELRPDGLAIEWRIGRGDAPEPASGQWMPEEGGRVRLVMPDTPDRVLEVGEETLRVRGQPEEGSTTPR